MSGSSWQECNVLKTAAEGRTLWRFSSKGGPSNWELSGDFKSLASEALPTRVIRKDWKNLWSGKQNIAWLPADRVGLRVLHLPKCDPAELHSMVELQVEKLSPLPLNQALWTLESLPHSDPAMQTVLVAIVDRRLVEDFLGQLEKSGYLADRLDWPLLHHLTGMRFDRDGVWVFLEPNGSKTGCLIVWAYGGVVQDVGWFTFAGGADAAHLVSDQVGRMAWAGELQGWLTQPPVWTVVAPESVQTAWSNSLSALLGTTPGEAPWPEPKKLAEANVSRAATGASPLSLLPPEFAARYRQQFVDRLWMNGLGAILGLYVIGVLIYFGALEVRKHQHGKLQAELVSTSLSYTNALEIQAKLKVLQDQSDLRFAALDSWRVASELLPAELSLTSFDFSRGRILTLHGTAPTDQQSKITEFNAALAKATVDDQLLFSRVSPASITPLGGAMSGSAQWSFACEIRRPEGME